MPIIFLSCEKNYNQIEKETLGITFAVKIFHKFIKGKRSSTQTEHRPLLSIFESKKSILTHTAIRLQRWRRILLNYNYKMEFQKSDLRAENEIKNVICNTVRDLPETQDETQIKSHLDTFNRLKEASKVQIEGEI